MDQGSNWLFQAAPEFGSAMNHLKSVHHLPAGSTIVERGSFADRVVFVDAGSVRIVPSKETFPVSRLLAAGAVLGLNEALTGSEYKVTVQAHSDVRLSCITRSVLLEFLSKNPEVCMRLVGSLSEDLHGLYRRLGVLRARTLRRGKS